MAFNLLFLHGLLGSKSDWRAVFSHLQNIADFRPLALDLPAHGAEKNTPCANFAAARAYLKQTISHTIGDQPFWLVGYSLGGRLAMDLALTEPPSSLQGVILEGANIGLASEQARAQRWVHDQHWANRFRNEPLKQVLNDWYHQAVFADLSAQARQQLINARADNDGTQIARMLEATSLAKQPFYLSARNASPAFHFLIGARDQKFREMAQQYHLNHQLIADAGHNAHRENPAEFAEKLKQIILNPV